MNFQTALNQLPDVAGFDPSAHKTIEDLCYICLFELDLHAEGEYWHPLAVRKQLLAFCKKYGYYAKEAQKQFDAGRNLKKSDSYM
jgi:hypothetical protein